MAVARTPKRSDRDASFIPKIVIPIMMRDSTRRP